MPAKTSNPASARIPQFWPRRGLTTSFSAAKVRLVTTHHNCFALAFQTCYCLYRRHAFPLGVLEILSTPNRMVTATALHDLIAIEKLREQELEEARIIQSAMLPSHPLHEFDALISHEFQPVTEVGGDYIDYFTLTDGTIGLYLGDVSGKGLPAALYAALAIGTLCGIHKTGQRPGRVLLSTQPATASPGNSGAAYLDPIRDLFSGHWPDDHLERGNAGPLPFARSGMPPAWKSPASPQACSPASPTTSFLFSWSLGIRCCFVPMD